MANGSAVKATSKQKGENVFSRMGRFIRDSYNETVYKASWPTWTELRQLTLIVILAVVTVAVYIGILDFVLGKITEPLLHR